jgi:hypothetical protein
MLIIFFFPVLRISYHGLAAYPVKTLSLPIHLLSVEERSGQEVAQSSGLRAQGKTSCPSLSNLLKMNPLILKNLLIVI